MTVDFQIPEPFLFNPLKHHLGFMREFININIETCDREMAILTGRGAESSNDNGYAGPTRESTLHNQKSTQLISVLKHLGTSVMDVYTGLLTINRICNEIEEFLKNNNLFGLEKYSAWTAKEPENFRIIPLTDGSHWTLKFHSHPERFVHIFPARNSQHSFRVKSNTLKSAMIYSVLIGKDYISGDDLNKVRPLLGLSPIKDAADTEAILEMIEILRD
jgi:hypothetical protein